MDEDGRSQRLEKIRYHTEELRKLEEEERMLLEACPLDEESAWALFQSLISEPGMAQMPTDAPDKTPSIGY